jgi:hypothetical protein
MYKWIDSNGNTHFADHKPDVKVAYETLLRTKNSKNSEIKNELLLIANNDIKILKINDGKLGPLVIGESKTIASYKEFFHEISKRNIGYPSVKKYSIKSINNTKSIQFTIYISSDPKDQGKVLDLSSIFQRNSKPLRQFTSSSELNMFIKGLAENSVEIHEISTLESIVKIVGSYSKNSKLSKFLDELKTEGVGEPELKKISPKSFTIEVKTNSQY